MISLKQLRYFDSVARLKHFGKAAEQCSVTQPALSMQIQEMEKTLGVQLIERSRSGIMLTEAGREIARRATRILAETRDLAQELAAQGSFCRVWKADHRGDVGPDAGLGSGVAVRGAPIRGFILRDAADAAPQDEV